MTYEVRAALAALSVMCCSAACSGTGGAHAGGDNEPGASQSGGGGGADSRATGGGGGANVPGDGSGGGTVPSGQGGGSAAAGGGGAAGGDAAQGGGSASPGGGSATGGGAPSSVAFTPGASGCAPLTLEAGVSVSGYLSDRYRWSDGACLARSAALVRNTTADPGGSYGGYLRELTYPLNGTTVTARGTNTNGYNGWGYVVNHYTGGSDSSKRHAGTYRVVFAGQHHAIHEFKVRTNPGGPVDATVQWFFATGRSHPIYFIRYDLNAAGSGGVSADSRAPYGDMAFEGNAGAIGGVAWGDKYRFTTTSSPVTTGSSWDYTQPNTVPFVRMWSQNVDAEMGAVQTESWEQRPAGGDYGNGTLASQCWGRTSASGSCRGPGWTMPQDWLWPFQLNQYELPATTASHRLAWGMTYGALGKPSYSAFGKTLTGYPNVAYSVFMTMGPRSSSATLAQVTEVERTLATQVDATVGGPATYQPAYALWDVPMASGQATVSVNPTGGAVTAPIFRFTDYPGTGPSHVQLDGQETSAYFASVDTATHTLWLTLNGTVTGPVSLHVE